MSRETPVSIFCQFSGKPLTLLSHGKVQKNLSTLRSFAVAGGKETPRNDQVGLDDESLDPSLAKGLQCSASMWL